MSETDYLSAAQLGFLYLARGDTAAAMPLLERVLKSGDEELANRVRAVLRIPQTLQKRPSEPAVESVDAKIMAERSFKAGFMKDALKYLQIAEEADPADFAVMLKLGWTYNLLHNDEQAVRWFDLARKSPDPKISREANEAFEHLHGALERVRLTFWIFPMYSSRWSDLFSYAQFKSELRLKFPIHPYLSFRFIGDTRGTTGPEGAGLLPQYLSESAVIPAFGLATSLLARADGMGRSGLGHRVSNGSLRGRLSRRRFVHQGLRALVAVEDRRLVFRNQ